MTRGYARRPGGYHRHDQPKRVLVYPLSAQARQGLCSPQLPPDWSPGMQAVRLSSAQMTQLHQRLRALPDTRHRRGIRHRFATTLTIAIAAMLAQARSYLAIAEWAARLSQREPKRLGARYNRRTQRFEPSCESTLRRTLQSADAEAVDREPGQWLMQWAGSAEAAPALAVDGKTARGARRAAGSQVHLLSAFLHHSGVSVVQREVGAKTNEIPELPRLLEPLPIRRAGLLPGAGGHRHHKRPTAHGAPLRADQPLPGPGQRRAAAQAQPRALEHQKPLALGPRSDLPCVFRSIRTPVSRGMGVRIGA